MVTSRVAARINVPPSRASSDNPSLNSQVESKIAAVREALKGSDVEAIKRATQDLNQTMQKIGEAIYKTQQPPPGGQPGGQQPPPPPPGGGQGPKDDGTVEGEFREV